VHVVFNDVRSRDVQLNSRRYTPDAALYQHLNTPYVSFIETGRSVTGSEESPHLPQAYEHASWPRAQTGLFSVFFDVREDKGVYLMWNPLLMSNVLAKVGGKAPHHRTAHG